MKMSEFLEGPFARLVHRLTATAAEIHHARIMAQVEAAPAMAGMPLEELAWERAKETMAAAQNDWSRRRKFSQEMTNEQAARALEALAVAAMKRMGLGC